MAEVRLVCGRFTRGIVYLGEAYGPGLIDEPVLVPEGEARTFIARGVFREEPEAVTVAIPAETSPPAGPPAPPSGDQPPPPPAATE